MIQKSKNNKSPGLDNNEWIIEKWWFRYEHFGLISKAHSMNSTPSEWNIGIIIPIFKNGHHKDLDNYRGISLSSCVSKSFNRIIADTISGFLEIITPYRKSKEVLERTIVARIIFLP